MRPIDADALIESIKNTADLGGWIGETLYQIKQVAVKYINSAPTIEPKRGEWKVTAIKAYKGDILLGGYCSVCGYKNHHFDYKFCPNCGAMMKGADDE